MSEQPSRVPPSPLDGDNGDDYRELMDERITKLENQMGEVVQRLARIETRMDGLATKEFVMALHIDVSKELHALTSKLVTFVCGFGSALVAVTFYIARYVAPAG